MWVTDPSVLPVKAGPQAEKRDRWIIVVRIVHKIESF